MIIVTNAKVAGFVPQWAAFRGFSVLFDNPGNCLDHSSNYAEMACDVASDPALGFYRTLRDTLAGLDVRLLTHTYGFCPLPELSYHVTVWDGVNDGNVQKVAATHHETLEQLLADVRAALRQPHDLIEMVQESPLVTRCDWNLTFSFNHLSLIGRSVLVAELSPATTGDAERLQELVGERTALSGRVQARYGFSPYQQYWPHVSLGYFANRELAQLAMPSVQEWSATFAEALADRTVTFTQARVYGFNDMATFFTYNNANTYTKR